MRIFYGTGLIWLLVIHITVAQHDPKALEILNAMSKKYKSVPIYKAEFTYTLENVQEKINEDSKGEITVKGNKFRLKMAEQEIINNSKTVWTYFPETNEVNISNYDPQEDEFTPSKIYTAYERGFKYVMVDEKGEVGNTYHVVDLIPESKDTQYFRIRMYIYKKDKSLKRWVLFDKNGSQYNYSIANFNPNPKVADSYFEFDKAKYKGVEVVDLR